MRPKKEMSKPTSMKARQDHSSATTPEYTHYAPEPLERVVGLPDAPHPTGPQGTPPAEAPLWGPASRTAKKP